jgi:hypothetical protein
MTNHIFDPRPGWIRDRTYELHSSGLRWIDARQQAETEADELDRQQCHRCDCDGLLWGAGEDGDPIVCDHQAD